MIFNKIIFLQTKPFSQNTVISFQYSHLNSEKSTVCSFVFSFVGLSSACEVTQLKTRTAGHLRDRCKLWKLLKRHLCKKIDCRVFWEESDLVILGRLIAPATLKLLSCGQSKFLPPIGPKGHLQSRHKRHQVMRSPRLKKLNFGGQNWPEIKHIGQISGTNSQTPCSNYSELSN